MPPERKQADNAVEWLNRAQSDLTLAGNRIENVYLEDLCFHAQQAAEKGLKAIFVSRGFLLCVSSMRRLVKKRTTWRSLVFDPEACHASIRTL